MAGAVLTVRNLFPLVYMGLRFPQQTIVQYSQSILGSIPGKVVGLILVVYWLKIAADVMYSVGDAYTITVKPETPILVFIILSAFMGAYAARHGLEVIGRMSLSFMILVAVIGLLVIVLPFESDKLKNLLPVMENGMEPLIKPVAVSLSFYAQFVVIGMVLPYLNKIRDSVKFSAYGLIITGMLVILFSVTLTAVFDVTAKDLSVPAYSLARMIRIARFVERVEAIVLVSWTLSAAIKIALMLWASSLGLAQIFGTPIHNALIYPLGVVAIIAGYLLYDNHMEFISASIQSAPWIFLTVAALIVLLLVGVLLRGNSRSPGGA
jgi:spore germination protein KB